MEVWSPSEASNNETNKEDKERRICLPMEKWVKQMMWDTQGFLIFGVYHKKGRQESMWIAVAATGLALSNQSCQESTYA
eukprot:12615193-Ditylum_brightwellii.AAC.1